MNTQLQKSIIIVFAASLAACNLTVDVGVGGGVISNTGLNCPASDCSQPMQPNVIVKLNAIPNDGYFFGRWDGCDQVVNDSCSVSSATALPRTVKAYFIKNLTLSESSISPDIKSCLTTNLYNKLSDIAEIKCDWTSSLNMDLTGLDQLARLNTIALYGGGISDTSLFVNFPHLSILSLYGQQLTNIASLMSLPSSMQEIGLNGNPNIDCSSVKQLRTKFGANVVFANTCQ